MKKIYFFGKKIAQVSVVILTEVQWDISDLPFVRNNGYQS